MAGRVKDASLSKDGLTKGADRAKKGVQQAIANVCGAGRRWKPSREKA